MTPGSDAANALGRLWLTWASTFAHDVGASVSMAHGYARMLHKVPADDPRRSQMFDEQEKAFARLSSLAGAVNSCSRRSQSVDDVVRRFESLYRDRLSITRAGDVRIDSPNEHLGVILWLLLDAQGRAGDVTTVDVTITDAFGRITVGPDAQAELETWTSIDTTTAERWWLFDAVDYLRFCGYTVDLRYRGDEWVLVLTWSRGQ
jgi:hypothetical protein